MADILLMEHVEISLDRALMRERVLKDRSNPLEDLLPKQVKAKYRFEPETIFALCRLLRTKLQRPTRRSNSLPVLWQILVALRFYATGSYYLVVADSLKISKSSVCRCIWAVTKGLVEMTKIMIKIPDQAALLNVRRAFFAIGGIPNVTGAVDGCLVKIMRPKENTAEFISRKHFPAINMQICCGPDNMIYNSVVKWPGAVHDSRIFAGSNLKQLYETGKYRLLLGDSGYQLTHYMLVPFQTVTSDAQEKFNVGQRKACTKVEHTFGILKSRFACLSDPLKVASPARCCFIIQACLVLHNFGTTRRDYIEFQMGARLPSDDDKKNNLSEDDASAAGVALRDHYVRRYFS